MHVHESKQSVKRIENLLGNRSQGASLQAVRWLEGLRGSYRSRFPPSVLQVLHLEREGAKLDLANLLPTFSEPPKIYGSGPNAMALGYSPNLIEYCAWVAGEISKTQLTPILWQQLLALWKALIGSGHYQSNHIPYTDISPVHRPYWALPVEFRNVLFRHNVAPSWQLSYWSRSCL